MIADGNLEEYALHGDAAFHLCLEFKRTKCSFLIKNYGRSGVLILIVVRQRVT